MNDRITFTRPLLLAVLLTGAALRFAAIGAKPLWLDEAFSLWMANQPVADMLGWTTQIDQHPPLYPILLHGWLRMAGTGEAGLRLLSAIFSVGTLPVFYNLALRLTGREATALTAFVLLALSPFHVQYAQEARMYALLTFLVVTAGYAACSLLEIQSNRSHLAFTHAKTPGHKDAGYRHRIVPVIAGALALSMAMLTHNVAAVFLPLALNVGVLAVLWRRRTDSQGAKSLLARRWIATQGLTLLVWLPWSPFFVQQAAGVAQRFWLQQPTLADVQTAIHTFNAAFMPPDFPLSWLWHLLFLGGAGFGLFRLNRRQPEAFRLVASWLFVPFLGLLLVSFYRPLFHPPSLLWVSPAYLIALAAGLRGLAFDRFRPASTPVSWMERTVTPLLAPRRNLLWPGLLALFLIGNMAGLHSYYQHYHKEAWDDVAAFVAGAVEPEDLLLFNAAWTQLPFDYYFDDYYLDDYDIEVEERGLPADLFSSGELEPPMTPADLPRLNQLVAGEARVWLIYSHDWFTDPEGLIPTALNAEMKEVLSKEFVGVRIYLYSRQ